MADWLFLIALLPLAAFVGRDVRSALKAGGFEDFTAESWNVKTAIERDFGVGQADSILIYTNEQGSADDPEALSGVLGALAKFERDAGVVHVLDYYKTGARQLLSRDGKSTAVIR